MHWQYNPYVLPLVIAAGLAAGLALYVWRRRSAPGSGLFVLLMIAVAEWSLGYALELGSVGLWSKVLWAKLEYLGIVTMPVAWLISALHYAGREQWVTPRRLALLIIVPVVVLLPPAPCAAPSRAFGPADAPLQLAHVVFSAAGPAQ